MSKHTPGPWQTREGLAPSNRDWVITTAHIDRVYRLAKIFATGDDSVDEANARLIAAAPELLSELETSNSMLEALARQLEAWGKQPVVNWHGQMRRNEAAIAKASGA